MEHEVLDLHDEEDPHEATVQEWLRKDEPHFGIIIGHCDDDGELFFEWNAKFFQTHCKRQHLWIHACNASRSIAPGCAKNGRVTYGFLTTILYRPGGPEIAISQRILREAGEGESGSTVKTRVQRAWLDEAKVALTERDLVEACRLAHLALTLRAHPA